VRAFALARESAAVLYLVVPRVKAFTYSLGRDGIAFGWFAQSSVKKGLPIRAANMQSAIMIALIVLFAACRVDPVMVIAPYLSIPSAIGNVSLMAGTSSVVVSILPWTTPAIAVAGALFAAWLRHARPTVYTRLGRFLSDS